MRRPGFMDPSSEITVRTGVLVTVVPLMGYLAFRRDLPWWARLGCAATGALTLWYEPKQIAQAKKELES
jgi:hypothetical protein